MQIIVETTTTKPVYDLFEKLGSGKIVEFDRWPVDECGQYEMENFTSITVEIEDEQPEGKEK